MQLSTCRALLKHRKTRKNRIQAQSQDSEILLAKARKERSTHRMCDCATSDRWTYELLGTLVCVSTLISIIAILFSFDGKPTPHTMNGVTLNTIISLLSTISRAAAVFVATSVIAQQKWLCFSEKFRPLIQIVAYEDATRGPLGSLYLLGRLRMSAVTCLAAVATVLALGIEPFVQQSITYPLRNQLDPLTVPPSIPIIQNLDFLMVDPSNFKSTNETTDSYKLNMTLTIGGVVAKALYADSVETIQPKCAGTMCDWPPYQSAAFCSLCQDVTQDTLIEPEFGSDGALEAFYRNDHLDKFRATDQYGRGEFLSLYHRYFTEYTMYIGQVLSGSMSLTLNAHVNASTGTIKTELLYPKGSVWNLYKSPRTNLNITMNNTVSILGEEDRLDAFIWRNETINDVPGPLYAFGYRELKPSVDSKRLVASSVKRCVISLCAQQYSTKFENNVMSSHVTDRDWGSYRNTSNGTSWISNLNNSSFRSANIFDKVIKAPNLVLSTCNGDMFSEESQSEDLPQNPNAVQFMTDVERNSAKIAQALTNFIQQHNDSYVEGQVYISTPHVEVRWAWLVFPISIVVTVLVALVTTMIQTKSRRLPVWKSSPFPLLYNFQNHEDRLILRNDESDVSASQPVTTSQHEKKAKKTRVRLKSTEGTWTFEKEV